jgi:hypothetical protein
VRAGIVGSGFAANLHYEGTRRVYGTDAELVGIFSHTPENARRFAEPRGLNTFASLGALLGEVDVVHVCASPAAHEAIAAATLARGVNAIVEKPLTGWFGEDFSATHVAFEDGAVADIFASEIVMGGIHNWLEVLANNHRSVCNINPNTAMQTYNPAEAQFRDIYVVEKIGTKQGWAPTAPDEDFILTRRSRIVWNSAVASLAVAGIADRTPRISQNAAVCSTRRT